mmetsp:Transcript_107908/g.186729  ORF Transcript_107908/g.186729 Transcript_107908/m.186729 type:complete len:82 (-) Transcript_107908:551-796(-)
MHCILIKAISTMPSVPGLPGVPGISEMLNCTDRIFSNTSRPIYKTCTSMAWECGKANQSCGACMKEISLYNLALTIPKALC